MKTSEEAKQIVEGLGHLAQAFNATDPNANIRAEYDNATETVTAVAYSSKKRIINVAVDSPLAAMKDISDGFYHLLY